jgi:hypothetical protein
MGTTVEDAMSETHETRRGPVRFSGAGGGNAMVYTIVLISSKDSYKHE